MAKKQFWEESWFMPLIVVIAAIYFVSKVSSLGMGGDVYVTNTTIITKLENAPYDYTDTGCGLSVSDTIICSGEEITTTITGNPNQQCLMYFNYEKSGWEYLGPITLNQYGVATITRAQEIAGEYQFGIVCGECVKITTVYVRPCADDDAEDASKYYCCSAMGVTSCYEDGCPPAGIELGEYDTLAQCQSDCSDGGSEDDDGDGSSDYTCGLSAWCPAGTCPTDYECASVEFLNYETCVCINGGTVHPDWKPGGIYHIQ